MLSACAAGDLQKAYVNMKSLCDMGYSAIDIITTVFKVQYSCAHCRHHTHTALLRGCSNNLRTQLAMQGNLGLMRWAVFGQAEQVLS